MSDQRLVRRRLDSGMVGSAVTPHPIAPSTPLGSGRTNVDEAPATARWVPSENLAGWPRGWLVRLGGRLR